MSSRSYFIPGMSSSQRDGNRRRLLPDIREERHHDQFHEWLDSRSETSHLEVGLNAGDKIHFRDAAGEDRPAIVIGEERDAHSGKIDVHLRASDEIGSGTYKMTFEGADARTLKQSRAKRIYE